MMFESHEFHLSLQSLDPISRDTQLKIYKPNEKH